MSDQESLDDIVRRVDPDRWLASRSIADEAVRADVIAVYALNDELARVAEAVSNSLVGEIRFAWWREGIVEVFEGGRPRQHPVLVALAAAADRGRLDRVMVEAMIEARHADLDGAPLADRVALDDYLDGTAGAVMALAAGLLGAEAPFTKVRAAGRAWGVAGLARSHWAGAPNRLPQDFTAAMVAETVDGELISARRELAGLPVAAFPAVAYAGLARDYARRREPSRLARQAKVLWATVRGRI